MAALSAPGVREIDGIHYVQTNAPISPGSSGGVLLSLQGEVIGVTTFNLSDAQNLNFAVATEHIEAVLRASNRSPFPKAEHAPVKVGPAYTEAEFTELQEKFGRLKTHTEKVHFLRAWADEQGRTPIGQAAAFMLLGGEYEAHDEQALALSYFEAAAARVNDAGQALSPLYYRLCRSYAVNARFRDAVEACTAAVTESQNHEVDGGELKGSWERLGYACRCSYQVGDEQ